MVLVCFWIISRWCWTPRPRCWWRGCTHSAWGMSGSAAPLTHCFLSSYQNRMIFEFSIWNKNGMNLFTCDRLGKHNPPRDRHTLLCLCGCGGCFYLFAFQSVTWTAPVIIRVWARGGERQGHLLWVFLYWAQYWLVIDCIASVEWGDGDSAATCKATSVFVLQTLQNWELTGIIKLKRKPALSNSNQIIFDTKMSVYE